MMRCFHVIKAASVIASKASTNRLFVKEFARVNNEETIKDLHQVFRKGSRGQ